MRALHAIFLLSLATQFGSAADFEIQSLDRDGRVTWSGAFTAGVVTVESKGSLLRPWPAPARNYFTSNTVGSAQASLTPTQTFVRLLSVDISTNTPNHYTNLLQSYGILETVAGRGSVDWDAFFEVAMQISPPVHFVIEREARNSKESDIAAARDLIAYHLVPQTSRGVRLEA